MNEPKKKNNPKRISRRNFITSSAMAGAGIAGLSHVGRVHAAKTVKLKIQTIWEGGSPGYVMFQDFCKYVRRMSNGKLQIDGYPAGTIVETYEMFDAVKARVFDGMHCFDAYWTNKMPAAAFLSSYPFGLDRPDQWETWYNALGGRKLAREAYAKHNMHHVGPIQQGVNLIHSTVPIRSLDDFKDIKIKCFGGITADFFKAIGAKTVPLPGDEVFPTIDKEDCDALFFGSAAVNDVSGYSDSAKYITTTTPSASRLHQPVNIMSIAVNQRTWKTIPKPLQLLFEAAVAKHSYQQYADFQKADMDAFNKLLGEEESETTSDTETSDKVTSKTMTSETEKTDTDATETAPLGPLVEIIRLSESDISALKQFAPAMWLKWAQKSPLATQAFESQLAYMKSLNTGYITDDEMVDLDGKKLVL